MTEWLQFFRKSGIERQDAAEYSSYFMENKITFDMLSELNSQYLKELGVTKVGHQIKILRHAKKIESENLKSKILAKEETSPVAKSNFPAPVVAKKSPPPKNDDNPKVTITVTKRPAEKIDAKSSSSIFNRLGRSSDEDYQPAKKMRQNIFDRLGNYEKNFVNRNLLTCKSELERKQEQTEQKLAAISLQKTVAVTRVFKPERPMPVAIKDVKPPKIQSRLSIDEKQVKFSKEVEFRLYSNPDFKSASSKQAKDKIKNDNIKSRLGFKESPKGDILEKRQVAQVKPTTKHPVGRFTAAPGSLVSDTVLTQSVHSRLGNKSSPRKRSFVS